ncbi:MAG: PfkB family carbohydrate kinase [Spirochaetia bacterium]|jgi:fructokinase|nr:PfkB family carbohydrate kinase [Spirochaetia bacterium]
MVLTIGETLIDSFPSYSRIGGAPLNFSIHCANLGEDVSIVSRTGSDADGMRIREFLEARGIGMEYLQRDFLHKTGKVIVKVSNNENYYDIVKDAAYDFIEYPVISDKQPEEIKCLYFGSLIQRTDNGFNVVHKLIDNMPPDALIFYDINLRPGNFTDRIIGKSLEKCTVLKVNGEELEYLKKLENMACDDRSAVLILMEKHNLKSAAVTRGEEGAEIFIGDKYLKDRIRKKIKVKDTVGAGDAFSSVLVKGLLDGWGLEEIMEKALKLAAAVCGLEGAVPGNDDGEFYSRIFNS